MRVAKGSAQHHFKCDFRLSSMLEDWTERLAAFFAHTASNHQHDWSRILPWTEYSQNPLVHSFTGFTPFLYVLGFQPLLFPWSGEHSNVPVVDDWIMRCEQTWEVAQSNWKEQCDTRRYKVTVTAPTLAAGANGVIINQGHLISEKALKKRVTSPIYRSI